MSKLIWDNVTRLAEELGLEISDANNEMLPGIYIRTEGEHSQRLSIENLVRICRGEDIRSEEDYTDYSPGDYEYAGEQNWSFLNCVFTVQVDHKHSLFNLEDQIERTQMVA